VRHQAGQSRSRGGFTLVELLLVVAMIAILLAILLPALSGALEAGRSFRCQMSLRASALDFNAFADDDLHGSRGDDELESTTEFRLETFQESQYGIDEFWAWGDVDSHTVPDSAGNNPMRCDSVDGDLVLKNNMSCTSGALQPPQSVSYTFNMRLHRIESEYKGMPVSKLVTLNSRILEQPMVPLVWDVDGAAAQDKGVLPVFSAPALDSEALYAGGTYWFPATRHNGAANFAFIDGHVDSSTRPLEESSWRWGFQPADD